MTIPRIERRVTHVVMHTAAASRLVGGRHVPVDQSAATIRAYHVRALGWRDIGYHGVIRFDGLFEQGREWETVGSHVAGFNAATIGLCWTGHGDHAAPTDAQWETAVRVVVALLRACRIDDEFLRNPMRVLGHREVDELPPAIYSAGRIAKTCPGTRVDMRAFRRAVGRALA